MIQSSATARDLVVLVDERDAELGVAPKLDVHRDGRLHRAVSVVLFDADGRVLVQRRAADKYHSAGLWSNAACGHPRPTEPALDAARRRLRAEMGIGAVDLALASRFIYHAEVAGGLIEHELDHVFVGVWTGEPAPDPGEVSAWRWVRRRELEADLHLNPGRYTAWLSYVLGRATVGAAADERRHGEEH